MCVYGQRVSIPRSCWIGDPGAYVIYQIYAACYDIVTSDMVRVTIQILWQGRRGLKSANTGIVVINLFSGWQIQIRPWRLTGSLNQSAPLFRHIVNACSIWQLLLMTKVSLLCTQQANLFPALGWLASTYDSQDWISNRGWGLNLDHTCGVHLSAVATGLLNRWTI